MRGDGMCQLFGLDEEPLIRHDPDNLLACILDLHRADQWNFLGDFTVGQDHPAIWQMVFAEPFRVRTVAKGRTHHNAGPFCDIDLLIREDWDCVTIQRNDSSSANHALITFIGGVDK